MIAWKFLAVFILLLMLQRTKGSRIKKSQNCTEDVKNNYCYVRDSDNLSQARHFSTKSAYNIFKNESFSQSFNIPKCKPTKFWMLARHGTRLPSDKDIKKMQKGLKEIQDKIIKNSNKGKLCDADYKAITNWKWDSNITTEYGYFLTVQGWNDLKLLAQRYQSILPNLIPKTYSSEKFLFRHTNIQRTEASFKGFVEGLFGPNAHEGITLNNNNELLRPYANCSAWKTQGDNLDLPTSEVNKFIASNIFQDTLKQVSKRLGLTVPLTADEIELIWDMCRYELAWNLDKISPWCISFTKTHVKVLEYKEDLKYYYKNGYGYEKVNSKLPCALVADMMNSLKNDSQPQVIAYFAHDRDLQLITTALGINKNKKPLKANNFLENSRRTWRTSDMTPFAGNLVVIKYLCSRSNKKHLKKEKVMFLLNEKPIYFDWCNKGLCDLTVLQQKYSYYITTDCSRTFCDGN